MNRVYNFGDSTLCWSLHYSLHSIGFDWSDCSRLGDNLINFECTCSFASAISFFMKKKRCTTLENLLYFKKMIDVKDRYSPRATRMDEIKKICVNYCWCGVTDENAFEYKYLYKIKIQLFKLNEAKWKWKRLWGNQKDICVGVSGDIHPFYYYSPGPSINLIN